MNTYFAPVSYQEKATLTKREQEVLELIAYEYSTKEIAAELFIGYQTVISYRKSLLKKLNVKNMAGLVRKAFEYGYLTLAIRSVA